MRSRKEIKTIKVFLTAIKKGGSEMEIEGQISVEDKKQARTMDFLYGKLVRGEPIYLDFKLGKIKDVKKKDKAQST